MKTRIACFLGVLFLGVCPLFARVAEFIKFDGITGESKQAGHTGWIEIDSFSFGVTQTGAHSGGGGGGAGKVAVHDISITKNYDKTSAFLANAVANGRHFKTVTLDVGTEHYVFEDVTITGVQSQGHASADGMAKETIKMAYLHDAIHDPPVDSKSNPIGAAVTTRVVTPIPPNAAFGGGIMGAAILQSLRLVGQTEAIIVVCDVAGGTTVAALQRAQQSGARAMPTLTIRANGKQPGQPSVQFTLTNVLVSGSSMAAGGCSQFTLHFSKFDGPPTGY